MGEANSDLETRTSLLSDHLIYPVRVQWCRVQWCRVVLVSCAPVRGQRSEVRGLWGSDVVCHYVPPPPPPPRPPLSYCHGKRSIFMSEILDTTSTFGYCLPRNVEIGTVYKGGTRVQE